MNPRALAIIVAVLPACFDDSLPKGAVVLCANDADCADGTECDTSAHVCTKPGVDVDSAAPALLSFVLQPADARDGVAVTLTLNADEALDNDAIPALTFAGDVADPGFIVVDRPAPASVVLGFTVNAALAEGYYVVRAVHLTDAHDNAADAPLDAALHVDRTAPVIASIGVTDELDDDALILSDDIGSDELDVRVLLSETADLVTSTVRLGSDALTCAALDGVLGLACHGTVGASALDGANVVSVHATDAAGNATDAQQVVQVDLDAPSIVGGTVALTVDGAVGPEASNGDRIELSFLVDEPLGAAPEVRVDSTQALDFAVTSSDGQFFTVALVLGQVLDEGVHTLSSTLVDRFGHSSTALVPLPAPYDTGVPFVAFPLSPCALSGICPDVDGDGYFGGSVSCGPGVATDCDDADPLVHPNAREIPGDGHANNCEPTAVDLPIDESVGVFVDPNATPAQPDGSRASPYLSFGVALAEAIAADKALFLVRGVVGVPLGALQIKVPLIGGMDAATWNYSNDVTVISNPDFDLRTFDNDNGPGAMRGLMMNLDVQGESENYGPAEWVNVTYGSLTTFSVIDLVHSAGGFTEIRDQGDGSRILDSDMGGIEIEVNGALVARSILGSVQVAPANDLTIVNSALFGDSAGVVKCNECARLGLFGDVLLGSAPTVFDIDDDDSLVPAQVTIENTIVAPEQGATFIRASGATNVTLRSVLLSWVGGALITRLDNGFALDNTPLHLDVLRACQWDGCGAAETLVPGTAALAAGDPLHLGDGPTSDAFQLGVTDLANAGVPGSAVADVDGLCRVEQGRVPNIGPDD